MSSFIQRSFSGGEIAPALYARVDTTKYATGLRKLRNFFVMRHGGAANRPGTKYIGEVKDSGKNVRLIPFVFSSTQTYVLEFGDLYIRFIKDGAYVESSPGVPYEITTEYLEADLPEIRYVQSADVVTLTHPTYPPMELSRISDTSWTIAAISFEPNFSTEDYSFLTGTVGGAGAVVKRYVVTAVSNITGEESLPMFKDYGALASVPEITAITNANPAVVTQVAHGYSNNDLVYMRINSVMGINDLNGVICKVANKTANTYELEGIDSTSYDPFVWSLVSSPNKSRALPISLKLTGAAPTAGAPHLLNWQVATPFTREYNVYKELNGVYGFIGISKDLTFNDIGYDPDTTTTPPEAFNPFPATDNYPSTVSYIQQRLMFANTNNAPESVWASKIGQYKNFTKNTPIQDDDTIKFTMAGRQVNRVKHLLDLGGKLVTFTEAGEWAIQGDASGVITPSQINPKQYSYNGSSSLPPLVIGGNAIYVQSRGSIVRDLGFDYQVDGYRGNDLTIFSAHLVDGYTLSDWAYQQVPHSVLWIVRSDGSLLGVTYVREQEMIGWSIHDFENGLVENVVIVPEGNEDAVYLVIKRTIDGATKRYVEKFNQRRVDDIVDSVFMDSSLSYDGRNYDVTTMTMSGGTTYTYDETITLTASASFFVVGDVGNEIHMTGSDGTVIRFSIEAYTSGTVVTGKPNKTVPVVMRSTAITDWSKAVDTLSGLDHLEGEQVSVFADGMVVANPNNSAYGLQTVASGSITLDKCYSVIHVGLPITADLQTLDIDTAQGETISDKKKLISKVTIFVEKSRGAFIGANPPSDDTVDPLEDLYEDRPRNSEGYENSASLITGTIDINIKPEWNSHGRVFVRQVDPLPLSVLAVVPAGLLPFKGGA